MTCKWSQPLYSYKETFIISFIPFKSHIAVNMKKSVMTQFKEKLDETDYSYTDMTFQIKWIQPVDYILLSDMIEFQLQEKEGYKTIWRKA